MSKFFAEGELPATVEPIDHRDSKTRFIVERCLDRRVLDLGCVMHDSRAYNSRFFLHRAIKERARELIGLDLHEEGVAALRALGYDARVGDACDFAFAEKFDVIVAGDIIEHVANLDGLMRSVDASLAPGGMLLVATPNPWFWRNVVKSVLYSEVPNNPEHTCWFCPRTWRQLVERYGFTLGEVEFSARYRRDAWMPLPRGVRMPSWHAETVRIG